MGYSKEQRIINSVSGNTKQKRNEKKESGETFVLPNKSGDHYRSYKRDTPTATTNYGKVYTKSDNKLYFQDGAGTEHEIAFV